MDSDNGNVDLVDSDDEIVDQYKATKAKKKFFFILSHRVENNRERLEAGAKIPLAAFMEIEAELHDKMIKLFIINFFIILDRQIFLGEQSMSIYYRWNRWYKYAHKDSYEKVCDG